MNFFKDRVEGKSKVDCCGYFIRIAVFWADNKLEESPAGKLKMCLNGEVNTLSLLLMLLGFRLEERVIAFPIFTKWEGWQMILLSTKIRPDLINFCAFLIELAQCNLNTTTSNLVSIRLTKLEGLFFSLGEKHEANFLTQPSDKPP